MVTTSTAITRRLAARLAIEFTAKTTTVSPLCIGLIFATQEAL